MYKSNLNGLKIMTLNEIKEKILEALPKAEVYVLDPRNDGHHLEAIVISDEFIGKSLVQQHQAVMNPLKDAFTTSVHALGLKTFTKEAWEKLVQKPI